MTFPKEFIWGTATAALQIEGAFNEEGKGESIWDRFCHTPGKVLNGDIADVACDHYHLYEKDIQLMKELGVKNYRLSISWPRIFPKGYGEINEAGLAFYDRLINALIQAGITPAITLYHWDLPQKLQNMGGWANRQTVEYFEQYAKLMFEKFGDRVTHWITHNEPYVVSFIGHWVGRHAPGITDFSLALQVSHHLLLSHGKAVRAYRALGLKGEIGITLNMNPVYAASEEPADQMAAERFNQYHNKWFSDPIYKGKYPEEILEWYRGKVVMPEILEGDMDVIASPIDFLGINNYFSSVIKNNPAIWPLQLEAVTTGKEQTKMGWEVNPVGIHDLLISLNQQYPGVKIMITENGAAFDDVVTEEHTVEDDKRLNYLIEHIEQVYRALQEGVHVAGYYVWSFMDNFEWAFGYERRFGIVYVDFESKERIVKRSGKWYSQVIQNNGF